MICRQCRLEYHRLWKACPRCYGFEVKTREAKPKVAKKRKSATTKGRRMGAQPRRKKVPRVLTIYVEGAAGHCYHCGRPEGEHNEFGCP